MVGLYHKSTTMKKLIKIAVPLFLLLLKTINTVAQQYTLRTEIHSSYIDLSGLFGVNEFSGTTAVNYKKGNFSFDLVHTYSLENNGKAINSYVAPGYLFKFDSASKITLQVRADFVYNTALELGLFRPVITLSYKPNKSHQLSYTNFGFHDIRNLKEGERHIQGDANVFSYAYTKSLKKWSLRTESRLSYAFIHNIRRAADVLQVTRITYQPLKIYAGGTYGYIFYNTRGEKGSIWNMNIGINF
jgi:hypothetical protein